MTRGPAPARRSPARLTAILAVCAALALSAAVGAQADDEEDFRRAMRQGAEHARRGEYPRALARFRQARDIKPGDAEARYRLALTFSDLGAYDSAEEEARKATVLDDAYAPAWLVLGTALFHQDREEDAVKALDRALLLDPENAHAAYMLGRSHYFLGQRRRLRAANLLNRAADEEETLRAETIDRDAEASYRSALKLFRRTLQLAPDYAAARFMEGCALLELDLPEAARDSLQRALRADPDNAEIHFRLGVCYLHSTRYMDAERSFREALRLDRDHIGAHLFLGDLFTRRLPDEDQARLHLERFLRDAPESHPARPRVEALLRRRNEGPVQQ
jgi:tetratricopeptide (TPR) repeat protein